MFTLCGRAVFGHEGKEERETRHETSAHEGREGWNDAVDVAERGIMQRQRHEEGRNEKPAFRALTQRVSVRTGEIIIQQYEAQPTSTFRFAPLCSVGTSRIVTDFGWIMPGREEREEREREKLTLYEVWLVSPVEQEERSG